MRKLTAEEEEKITKHIPQAYYQASKLAAKDVKDGKDKGVDKLTDKYFHRLMNEHAAKLDLRII